MSSSANFWPHKHSQSWEQAKFTWLFTFLCKVYFIIASLLNGNTTSISLNEEQTGNNAEVFRMSNKCHVFHEAESKVAGKTEGFNELLTSTNIFLVVCGENSTVWIKRPSSLQNRISIKRWMIPVKCSISSRQCIQGEVWLIENLMHLFPQTCTQT